MFVLVSKFNQNYINTKIFKNNNLTFIQYLKNFNSLIISIHNISLLLHIKTLFRNILEYPIKYVMSSINSLFLIHSMNK
jgi:hypothetical protein